MARSTYIYLILQDNKPWGAFTVKYEMEYQLSSLCGDMEGIRVLRMKDRPDVWSPEAPVDITKDYA